MEWVTWIVVIGILLFHSVFDVIERKLPFVTLLMAGAASLGYVLWLLFTGETTGSDICMRAVPGVLLLLCAFLTREKVGSGDGILLLITGNFLGYENSAAGFLLALFLSFVISVVLLLLRRADRHTRIPFAPCMTFGVAAQCILQMGVFG